MGYLLPKFYWNRLFSVKFDYFVLEKVAVNGAMGRAGI